MSDLQVLKSFKLDVKLPENQKNIQLAFDEKSQQIAILNLQNQHLYVIMPGKPLANLDLSTFCSYMIHEEKV